MAEALREPYRGAVLVSWLPERGKPIPPSWMDHVLIEMPGTVLDGKTFQRGTAMRLVDWQMDTGGDPERRPFPWLKLSAGTAPAKAPTPPAPAPEPPVLALEPPDPEAASAAALLRAVLEQGVKPEVDEVMHINAGAGSGFRRTYKGMPGFVRWDGRRGASYTHRLLPDWEYQREELREMLADLENVAAGRGQPTKATRPADPAPPPAANDPGRRTTGRGKRQPTYQRDATGRLVF